MIPPVLEAHLVERRHRLITARGPRLAAIEQRQLDILERARARQQVEALKHEAEILAPQQRALIAVEPFDMMATEQEFALGRHIEATEDVHRSRLARSRWAHHRDETALIDMEIDRKSAV